MMFGGCRTRRVGKTEADAARQPDRHAPGIQRTQNDAGRDAETQARQGAGSEWPGSRVFRTMFAFTVQGIAGCWPVRNYFCRITAQIPAIWYHICASCSLPYRAYRILVSQISAILYSKLLLYHGLSIPEPPENGTGFSWQIELGKPDLDHELEPGQRYCELSAYTY